MDGLETQYEAIEAAICQEIKSGTTNAGILAGKSMLDQDTGVAKMNARHW